MLVLSRKTGQELVIDDRIRVVVQRVQGNRVVLGIEAPDDVHIMRGELQRVRQEFQDSTPPVVSVELPIGLHAPAVA